MCREFGKQAHFIQFMSKEQGRGRRVIATLFLEAYRVGASTRAKNAREPSAVSSACSTGSANAAVLPDPVSARPIMSFPASVGYRKRSITRRARVRTFQRWGNRLALNRSRLLVSARFTGLAQCLVEPLACQSEEASGERHTKAANVFSTSAAIVNNGVDPGRPADCIMP